MRFKLKLKIIKTLYIRNFGKNILISMLLITTNLIVILFLTFYTSGQSFLVKIPQSYYEYLSVDIEQNTQLPSNNELVNIKQTKRPAALLLNSMMTHTGPFVVKPTYSHFLENSTFSLYGKVIQSPHIIICNNESNLVAINQTYFEMLQNEVQIENQSFDLAFKVLTSLIVNEQELLFEINEMLSVQIIVSEINYFAIPKLYLSQAYVDNVFGNTLLDDESTFEEYLLSLHDDHPLTNHRYRLHFPNEKTYFKFKKVINEISNEQTRLELIGDYIIKTATFTALFNYLNIIIVLFLIITLIGFLTITIIVGHTSINAITKQFALLKIFNARDSFLHRINFFIGVINYSWSLTVFLLTPIIIKLINVLIQEQIGVISLITRNNFVEVIIPLISITLIQAVMYFILTNNLKKPIYEVLTNND